MSDDLYLLNPPEQTPTVILRGITGSGKAKTIITNPNNAQKYLGKGWVPANPDKVKEAVGNYPDEHDFITIMKKGNGLLAVRPEDVGRRTALGWTIANQADVDKFNEMQEQIPPLLVEENQLNYYIDRGWTDTTDDEKEAFFNQYMNTGYVATLLKKHFDIDTTPDVSSSSKSTVGYDPTEVKATVKATMPTATVSRNYTPRELKAMRPRSVRVSTVKSTMRKL